MIETIFIRDRIRLIGERRLFFLILLILPALHGMAQLGCLDPQAINYDTQATISDGSCEYPVTSLSTTEIGTLPGALDECSGFIKYNSGYIGINDSGSDPDLFFLDGSNFSLSSQITLSDAGNIDWEEITVDDEFLYIGDIGNNSGNRTNLKIYKLPLSGLDSSAMVAEVIEFGYEDQTNFDNNFLNTPYDCEAFVVKGDSIHLFTKDWVNNNTRHYRMANVQGAHSAELIDSFYAAGLVTGASLVADTMLLLTGYGSEAFCWLLKDYPEQSFLDGNKRKFGLGNLGQNESITWLQEGMALITNEGGFGQGQVFSFDFIDLITAVNDGVAKQPITIFPNPFRNVLYMSLDQGVDGEVQIYELSGKLILQQGVSSASAQLSTDALQSGTYLLRLILPVGLFSQLIFKLE